MNPRRISRLTPSRGVSRPRISLVLMGLGVSVSVLSPIALADPAPVPPAAAPAPADAVDAGAVDVQKLLNEPAPTSVDGLLARADLISRVAAATSDNLEKTRASLAGSREALTRANGEAERAAAQVAQAQQRLEESRGSVAAISQAKYRGATVDSISTVVGSTGPQAAMDRSAYMTALADGTDRVLSSFEQDLVAAHNASSAAARAKALAEFESRNLEAQQRTLDERAKTLDSLKREVTKIVDGFTPEQRRQWVDRNGPIDVDVATFLGQIRASGSSAATQGAVAAAMSKLGAPYSWGAAGPDAFDCSGLMMWAYAQTGKSIPRTSQAQLAGGQPVSTSELQPGDIVAYYPGATHVGMYIGDGKIVHASDYGIPVQVVGVNSMPIAGAVRY